MLITIRRFWQRVMDVGLFAGIPFVLFLIANIALAAESDRARYAVANIGDITCPEASQLLQHLDATKLNKSEAIKWAAALAYVGGAWETNYFRLFPRDKNPRSPHTQAALGLLIMHECKTHPLLTLRAATRLYLKKLFP